MKLISQKTSKNAHLEKTVITFNFSAIFISLALLQKSINVIKFGIKQ